MKVENIVKKNKFLRDFANASHMRAA